MSVLGDAPSDSDARVWLSLMRGAEAPALLESLFKSVAEEVARRGPACWASGRCCNFERSGHRLYVTGLEAAYTLLRLGRPFEEAEIDRALDRGGCPFQSANLCGVHTIKPVACRLYFCDRSAQPWQHELSERMQQSLRDLHERLAAPYCYAEWRALLRAVARAAPLNP